MKPLPIRGRGAADNPPNRFEPITMERDGWTEADPLPRTRFLRDHSRSVVARNDSPDIGFNVSVNPYRGCEFGCVWCYARPTHEYLGFSSGLDFETKILVKEDTPALLRRELSRPGWKPQVLALSSVTDPYQPIERRLGITRRVLEVLAEFRNPVAVITKSYLVTRDIDVLSELAKDRAASVSLSITTLDHDLQRAMEPRASSPERRLRAIERLAEAGIPVGVNVAPVIPGLTEHEMPAILEAAADAGATRAMYVLLRLPYGVASLFEEWLLRNFPDRKEKVLGRIREMRGGRLNDPRFRSRMKGEGVLAEHIGELFAVSRRRSGLTGSNPPLSAEAFRARRRNRQLSLFSTSSG